MGWVEKKQAVGMSYCELYIDNRWVGGWVGKEDVPSCDLAWCGGRGRVG